MLNYNIPDNENEYALPKNEFSTVYKSFAVHSVYWNQKSYTPLQNRHYSTFFWLYNAVQSENVVQIKGSLERKWVGLLSKLSA